VEDVVVVGAGLAGHRVVSALRKHGHTGGITVVGDEPIGPYDRPPLSKQVLAGSMSRDELLFPVADLDVTWRLGIPAVRLDTAGHRITLADGAQLDFDRLVIATGRAARQWPRPVPGGVHVIRTVDDSFAFRSQITPSAAVVIVGAGFIGCEVAATLRELGVGSVTLVDVAPLPMAPLGSHLGRFAADYHRDQGVRLRFGRGVADLLEREGRISAVVLDDGEQLAADVVLLGLGSVPNTAWLTDSGLSLAGGAVVCDEYLYVEGRDDILAIGDVAAVPRAADNASASVEHWSNARETAELAAHNLLATEPSARRAHWAVPTFWSDQYDLKIKSAGYLGLVDSFQVVESSDDPARPWMVVEGRRDGRLVAAVTVNKNRKIIEYTRALSAAVAV
jgi:3-phenylpropionate/trans-cinnamate dioxygenase ferredoxin reductase subunit